MKIAVIGTDVFFDPSTGKPLEGRLSVLLRDSDNLADVFTLEGSAFVQAENPTLIHGGYVDNSLFADAGIYRIRVEHYTGPEGQMSVDSPDEYFAAVDIYEAGFDWDSAVTNAQNVDTIEDLRQVDPELKAVTVLGYSAVGDCVPRTYVWDKDAVDAIDGGYVVGSDVSDTGRWILLWGDEILPCTVYGVRPGSESNMNALMGYQRTVGSFSLVTAPCVRFIPGDYTSDTSFITDKEIVMDGGAKFTLATIQCPRVRVLGSRSSYVGNFVFTAPDAEAHSSWFRTLQGFWKCDATVLYVDGTNYFTSNILAGNISLSHKKIIGSTRLEATYNANAFYTIDQSTAITGRIFGPNDYVKVSGQGDGAWLTGGSWDPGLISAGHHQEWQNTPDLDLFENADRWVETMVERRTRITNMGNVLDLQYRSVGRVNIGLFTTAKNFSTERLTVSNAGADVVLENVITPELVATCATLYVDGSDVTLKAEPTVSTFTGRDSYIAVSGAAWRTMGLHLAFTGCQIEGLDIRKDLNNEDYGAGISLTDSVVYNSTIYAKGLQLLNCNCTQCDIRILPYLDSGVYHLDAKFISNCFNSPNPVLFTKAVESEDCYDCVFGVEITGNTFIGNSEGLACRYWSNRTGINYTRTFIKESTGHSIVYSGNSGNCPKESGKGILISDNTDYVHKDVGGLDVYAYKNNAFRGFPKLSGMRTFWYSCNTTGESDTMIKWKLNEATLPLFLQSFGYYMMAHDDSLTNGSYFDLCPSTVGSFIKIDPVTNGISAKVL